MDQTVLQALQIAGIGLPVMFLVIGLFILLAKLLLKVFPEKSES